MTPDNNRVERIQPRSEDHRVSQGQLIQFGKSHYGRIDLDHGVEGAATRDPDD